MIHDTSSTRAPVLTRWVTTRLHWIHRCGHCGLETWSERESGPYPYGCPSECLRCGQTFHMSRYSKTGGAPCATRVPC